MNLKEEKYSKFALVREMMETPDILRSFDHGVTERFIKPLKSKKAFS